MMRGIIGVMLFVILTFEFTAAHVKNRAYGAESTSGLLVSPRPLRCGDKEFAGQCQPTREWLKPHVVDENGTIVVPLDFECPARTGDYNRIEAVVPFGKRPYLVWTQVVYGNPPNNTNPKHYERNTVSWDRVKKQVQKLDPNRFRDVNLPWTEESLAVSKAQMAADANEHRNVVCGVVDSVWEEHDASLLQNYRDLLNDTWSK